jgi:teichuronic acid biosynthesis glycosyltransferase TuaC
MNAGHSPDPRGDRSPDPTGDRFAGAGGDRPTDRFRVLIVANMYPSAASPSYGVFVADQVAALRATGEVDVEVFHWDARRRPWRYALAALELALTRVEADVVHAHYGLSGVVALAAPRRLPLVLTVHGRDCHHPVVKRLTSLVARRAAAVVAVSDDLAALCPFPIAAVIPPGVDLEQFRPLPRAEARSRLGLTARPAARRLIVFPADPQRPEKRYADARALIERLTAIRPDVELKAVFGRPRAEMPLWLNAADAVVVTSQREGYGLACVEALACEVPVLSTPVGVAPALLAGIDGCLCAPFDAARWSEHLDAVLSADEPRVDGRAVAETQGLPAAARRTLQLYRSL